MNIDDLKKKRRMNDYFAYIALWQFLVFILLIAVIWIIEIVDLAGVCFGASAAKTYMFRGCVLTAAVLFCAIVMVGNTYLQQKQIITGLITVCCECHKVKIDEKKWSSMRRYIEHKTMAALSHGLCPDCYAKELKE
jgi:hypothetical protein